MFVCALLRPLSIMASLLLAASDSTQTPSVAPANPGNPPVARLTEDQAIERAVHFYTALRNLDGVSIRYRVESKPTGVTPRVFAWTWCDFDVALKSPMIFMQFDHPQALALLTPANKQDEIRETYMWDGKVGVTVAAQQTPAAGGGREAPAHVGIQAQAPRKLFDFDVLFRALCVKLDVPVNDQDLGLESRFPKNDYWMPDALLQNKTQYRLQPEPEMIGGRRCRVLIRGQHDRIWISEDSPQVVVRRQYSWPDDKQLRLDIAYSDFTPIAGDGWLPKKIIRQDYCVPWDKQGLQNKIADTLTIAVTDFDAHPPADTKFTGVTIPAGAQCYDWRTESYFTNFSKSDTPLDVALARATERAGSLGQSATKSSRRTLLIAVNASLLVAAIVLGLYLRRRNAGNRG